MKKYIIMIFAGVLAMTSCMNDFDENNIASNTFTATDIAEPNTTIAKVRSQYNSVISNSSYQEITTDEIFEGVVVANDVSGNIYQFVYLQEVNNDGTMNTDEGGIALGVKGLGCLYTIFPVGQKVRVNLKGLYVGGYGASPRIGMPYVNTNGALRLGPMPYPYMKTNIQLVGTPRPEMVEAREIKASDLSSNNITKLTPMLVVMKNAEIKDAGWPYAHWEVGGDTYSEYHDISIDGQNVKQLLYTSTSATFAGDTIRAGKKTIYGLLNRYTSSYQLSIRSLDDIIEIAK